MNEFAFYQSLATASAAMVSIMATVFLNRIFSHARETRDHFDRVQTDLAGALSRLTSAAVQITSRRDVGEDDRTTLATIAARYRALRNQQATRPQIKHLLRELAGHSEALGTSWGREQLAAHAAMLQRMDTGLERFGNMTRPRSLWAVLILLVWLTVFGIVFPLYVLTGGLFFPKGLMLLSFGLGVLAFEAFPLSELLRLLVWRRRFRWAG